MLQSEGRTCGFHLHNHCTHCLPLLGPAVPKELSRRFDAPQNFPPLRGAPHSYTHAHTLKTINFREDKGEEKKGPGVVKGKVSTCLAPTPRRGLLPFSSLPIHGAYKEVRGSPNIAPKSFLHSRSEMSLLGSGRSRLPTCGLGSQ